MCGRYTVTTKFAKVVLRWSFPFDDAGIQKLIPSFNIAPSQRIIAVWSGGDGKSLTGMRWGLIPPWAKDASVGNKMINARSETISQKPSFKKALKEQRCLIIADGFYEWQKKGKEKQPVRIVLKTRELFAFAGLWSEWTEPESSKEIITCAIITCEANTLLKQVHDRMPVILRREVEDAWLAEGLKEPADLLPMLKPYPDDQLEFYAVSKLVNTATVNEPALVDPV